MLNGEIVGRVFTINQKVRNFRIMDFQFMVILQIIFFVQRSKGLKLHKPLVLQRYHNNNVTVSLSLIKITSITISKIIRACMHRIILHTGKSFDPFVRGSTGNKPEVI